MPHSDAGPRADVVIGLAWAGDPATLAPTVDAVRCGIARYLESSQTRIVVAQRAPADSPGEHTGDLPPVSVPVTALTYTVDASDVLGTPYHGLAGRANALRALLETAYRSDAKACAILDASADVTPDCVRWLVRPILDRSMDFVTAYYPRHAVDGGITKSILAPIFRAVFGCRIRQPAARDFGCSRKTLAHVLDDSAWEEGSRDAAIDVWMSAEAVCSGLRIAEAGLACRQQELKVADVSTTLGQVAGSLFVEVERRSEFWQRVRPSVVVEEVGPPSSAMGREPTVDVPRLVESFRLGYQELRDIWSEMLPPMALVDLKQLAHAPIERFRLDDRLWARIVYDFAVAHRLHLVGRDHLLGSLTPLYLGWLSSFVLDTDHLEAAAVDARIERVSAGFEAEKRYLISRWRWPERFRN